MTVSKSKEYRKELAEMFARILEEKELEWKKEWKGIVNVPVNAVKERKYKGINAFALMLTMMDRGYTDPRFATYNQIKEMGCKLRDAKGKGVRVEYWFPYDCEEGRALTWEEFNVLCNGRPNERYMLRAKYSMVFNACHIEGLPERKLEIKNDISADELIAKLSENMGVEILHDGGDRAFYRPQEDKIHLPVPEVFDSDYAYNSTALHELAHSTGAPHRLNRNFGGGFGSESYAYEELIAEITSCFMSANLNLEQDAIHLDNHKAYVQSWVQSVREKPESLVKAIAEAEKTAAYMEYKAELIPEYEYQKTLGASMEITENEVSQIQDISNDYMVAHAVNENEYNMILDSYEAKGISFPYREEYDDKYLNNLCTAIKKWQMDTFYNLTDEEIIYLAKLEARHVDVSKISEAFGMGFIKEKFLEAVRSSMGIFDFRDLNNMDYIVLDAETTGFRSDDEIVELGITDKDGNVLYEGMFKPFRELSAEAGAVNGITMADLEDKPTFDSEFERILEIIGDKPLVIYNKGFDTRMLLQTARLHNRTDENYQNAIQSLEAHFEKNTYCAMQSYAEYKQFYKVTKLADALKEQGVEKVQSHRAVDDCRDTINLINAVYEKELRNELVQTRFFVDMDGTATEFKKVDTLETLYEEGYFYNLKPIENVVDAIKYIIKNHPEIEVYIMSSVLSDSKYALSEKNQWLDKYLPEIDRGHRIFPPCGENKLDYIPGGVRDTDLLLDDYTHNLTLWEPPAKGIKILNGINHTKETWRGNRLRYDKSPEELVENIIEIALNGAIIQDMKPQENELESILSRLEKIPEEMAEINKQLENSLDKDIIPIDVKSSDLGKKTVRQINQDTEKNILEKQQELVEKLKSIGASIEVSPKL